MPPALYVKSDPEHGRPARVAIFTSRNTVKGRSYLRHEIRWRDFFGHLRRLKKSNLAEARAEARRIANGLAQGRPECALSLAEIADYSAAVPHLRATFKSMAAVAEEFAQAHEITPGVSMPTLARYYKAHQRADNTTGRTIDELVETFLLELRARGMSARHQEDLRARLRRYAHENAQPMAEHTAATVQAWVLRLPVAPRTRNNYLAAVQTLFADAVLAHHPASPAIRLIKPSKLAPPIKHIWKPAELRELLTTAARFDAGLLPLIALGAFGKLRASEAAGLQAEDMRLDDAQILLRNGKTGARVIPIPANCVAWLRVHAPANGPIWPYSIDAMNAHLRRLAHRCRLMWRPNALRKSGQLYDTLMDADYNRVSREAGNSPRMMRRHYVDPTLATRADALEWFGLLPEKVERVIVPMGETAS